MTTLVWSASHISKTRVCGGVLPSIWTLLDTESEIDSEG